MDNNITLKELLEIIDSRNEFYNLKIFKANNKTRKAGEYINIPIAKIAHTQPIQENKKREVTKGINQSAKHIQHNNFTRNIQLPNNSIITIHPILVREINGLKLI